MWPPQRFSERKWTIMFWYCLKKPNISVTNYGFSNKKFFKMFASLNHLQHKILKPLASDILTKFLLCLYFLYSPKTIVKIPVPQNLHNISVAIVCSLHRSHGTVYISWQLFFLSTNLSGSRNNHVMPSLFFKRLGFPIAYTDCI